jgi:hypothetical protein
MRRTNMSRTSSSMPTRTEMPPAVLRKSDRRYTHKRKRSRSFDQTFQQQTVPEKTFHSQLPNRCPRREGGAAVVGNLNTLDASSSPEVAPHIQAIA